jgi:hypothetical protein
MSIGDTLLCIVTAFTGCYFYGIYMEYAATNNWSIAFTTIVVNMIPIIILFLCAFLYDFSRHIKLA